MVKRGKPAPDIYIEAAKRLGLETSQCLALEDSLNGMKSANAAGCVTVMVPDLDEPDENSLPLIHYVADGLTDIQKILEQCDVAQERG